MKMGEYYLDDYALDDEYDNLPTSNGMDINTNFEDNFDNYDNDSGSAYYENELVEDLDLGDDEDIIYEVDNLLSNYKKVLSRPVLFGDTIAADKIGNNRPEEPTSSGLWFMISVGVIISVVTVLFVLYLAFKQRYKRLQDEMDEKRQATIANQRARMAQMKQQMEAGNLIDAEALMFDSSSEEKPSSVSSPFFEHGRREDFTM